MMERNIKLLLCAIAKNENNYLKEWVEYYKQLGFDNIVLYDNNDINGENITTVLQEDIDSGFVILKDVRGTKKAQIKSYNECYHTIAQNYDWITFLDIDEFLVCNNIKQILSQDIYNKYDIISIAEEIVSDNNLIEVKNNNYSIHRFDKASTYHTRKIKQIIRCNKNIQITNTSGALNTNCSVCNTLGIKCKNQMFIDNQTYYNIFFRHYVYKTLDEFLNIKLKRGDPYNLNFHSLNSFFSFNQLTQDKKDYLNKLGIKYE